MEGKTYKTPKTRMPKVCYMSYWQFSYCNIIAILAYQLDMEIGHNHL